MVLLSAKLLNQKFIKAVIMIKFGSWKLQTSVCLSICLVQFQWLFSSSVIFYICFDVISLSQFCVHVHIWVLACMCVLCVLCVCLGLADCGIYLKS